MSWRDIRLALALIVVLSAYHTLAVRGCEMLTADAVGHIRLFP